ncbi:hypothetical protein [Streptomyces sp. NPDC048142]|uniref:hypothetical protein n=1 Tax=Streptomyces sp. NPDC048142 TaxID=3365501 RepID=UPI003720DAAA
MTLRSDYLWHIALGEQPPTELPSDPASVRMGVALGLPSINALVGDGTDVEPVRYCLAHRQVVVPVEADTVHRWMAAHSDCVPAAGVRGCGAGGYRDCTGLWVTHPGSERTAVTRARMRRAPGPHNPRHQEARCA